MTFKHYALIAIVVTAMLVLAEMAQAHDWYSSTRDPVTTSGCCGGNDCAPVPLDADWVQPVKDGFHVVMTLEQSKKINPYSVAPIDAFVPWSRVQSPPAGISGPPALYHVCISAVQRSVRGGIYCLFAVPSL